MAKKTAHRSTALTRAPARAPQTIVVRPVSGTTTRHKKHGGGRRKGGRLSSEKQLMAMAIGGLVAGFVDKSAVALPTIPMLGKMGTVALAAHFLGKGAPGIITDVRNAAAAIAGYEMGSTGKIAGDEDAYPAGPLGRGGSVRG